MSIEITKKPIYITEINILSHKITKGLAQSVSNLLMEVVILKKSLFGGQKLETKKYKCKLVFSSVTLLGDTELKREIEDAWKEFYLIAYENSKKKKHRIIEKDVAIMSRILGDEVEVLELEKKEIKVQEKSVSV